MLNPQEQCACRRDPCECEFDAKLVAEFRGAVQALDKIMSRILRKHSYATLYLDGTGNVNLMSGSSHTGGAHAVARQDRIMASVNVRHFGGGDW